MSMPRRVRAALCASLSLPALFLFGCSDDGTVTQNSSKPAMVTGNWQVSSAAPAASRFPAFSGVFTTQSEKTTAIVHSLAGSSCVSPKSSFELSGSEDENGNITLTGPLSSGTLALTGTVAADGKSLTKASYNVAGGACAFSQTVPAEALSFQPINGKYAGNFADTEGQVAQVTANFSQSTTPDADGNFTLAGSATISNNPCFPSAVPVADTQVTGGTFSFTYAANGNSVTATGTFSADASTLSITNWTSSGSCGGDTGVPSTMARQPS